MIRWLFMGFKSQIKVVNPYNVYGFKIFMSVGTLDGIQYEMLSSYMEPCRFKKFLGKSLFLI